MYFLNIQKLSKNGGLLQGGRNLRQYSFWEVIANTINGGTTDLYVVLDEAHREVKPVTDRKTIVQRIISGAAGSHPALPLVWGISATIARFTAAMDGVASRTSYPHVEVDVGRVRASGLIKDEIGYSGIRTHGSDGLDGRRPGQERGSRTRRYRTAIPAADPRDTRSSTTGTRTRRARQPRRPASQDQRRLNSVTECQVATDHDLSGGHRGLTCR